MYCLVENAGKTWQQTSRNCLLLWRKCNPAIHFPNTFTTCTKPSIKCWTKNRGFLMPMCARGTNTFAHVACNQTTRLAAANKSRADGVLPRSQTTTRQIGHPKRRGHPKRSGHPKRKKTKLDAWFLYMVKRPDVFCRLFLKRSKARQSKLTVDALRS